MKRIENEILPSILFFFFFIQSINNCSRCELTATLYRRYIMDNVFNAINESIQKRYDKTIATELIINGHRRVKEHNS